MPQLKPIHTERAYERALARIRKLMDSDPQGTRGQELDILANLVELYERKHFSLGTLDPGRRHRTPHGGAPSISA